MHRTIETAHLRSTLTTERVTTDDSGQALPRRPQDPVYRCFLSDLAGFTSLRRVGPSPQRPPTAILAQRPSLWEEFDPAVADCGCRAPLAPHLVRPHFHGMFSRLRCQFAICGGQRSFGNVAVPVTGLPQGHPLHSSTPRPPELKRHSGAEPAARRAIALENKSPAYRLREPSFPRERKSRGPIFSN